MGFCPWTVKLECSYGLCHHLEWVIIFVFPIPSWLRMSLILCNKKWRRRIYKIQRDRFWEVRMVFVVAELQEFSFLVFVVKEWSLSLCNWMCVKEHLWNWNSSQGSSGSVLILAQFSSLVPKREVWWFGARRNPSYTSLKADQLRNKKDYIEWE